MCVCVCSTVCLYICRTDLAIVKVIVTDINDNAPIFREKTLKATLTENNQVGTLIASFMVRICHLQLTKKMVVVKHVPLSRQLMLILVPTVSSPSR